MKKLNIGSGPSGLNNWINYDYGILPFLNKYNLLDLVVKFGFLNKSYKIKWPKIYLVDLRKKFPLKNGSIDYIYCSHVLEHFEPQEITHILNESRRVLKRGGIMRVVVPDIKYILNNFKNARQFNEYVYGYDKKNNYLFKRFIRGHQWMFDKDELKDTLKNNGFKNIKFYRFGNGKMPDIKRLDKREYKGNSLFVEASN